MRETNSFQVLPFLERVSLLVYMYKIYARDFIEQAVLKKDTVIVTQLIFRFCAYCFFFRSLETFSLK